MRCRRPRHVALSRCHASSHNREARRLPAPAWVGHRTPPVRPVRYPPRKSPPVLSRMATAGYRRRHACSDPRARSSTHSPRMLAIQEGAFRGQTSVEPLRTNVVLRNAPGRMVSRCTPIFPAGRLCFRRILWNSLLRKARIGKRIGTEDCRSPSVFAENAPAPQIAVRNILA